MTARADTPANCSYNEVVGTWLFLIGPGGGTAAQSWPHSLSHPTGDNTLNCSVPWEAAEEYEVILNFPDTVVDQDGNVGFWTIIYNQGFEIVINNKKLFAFFYYTVNGTNVTSYCDTTFSGWVHNVNETDWACFSGQLQDQFAHSRVHTQSPARLENVDADKTLFKQSELVSAINADSARSWHAAEYHEFNGKTLAQLQRRSGGANSGSAFAHLPPRTTKSGSIVDGELPSSFDWTDVDAGSVGVEWRALPALTCWVNSPTGPDTAWTWPPTRSWTAGCVPR